VHAPAKELDAGKRLSVRLQSTAICRPRPPLHEAILGKTLDKRNFRRRIADLGILKPLKEYRSDFGRPAKLFQFVATRFERLKDKGIVFPF
jgi:hypothetical protein